MLTVVPLRGHGPGPRPATTWPACWSRSCARTGLVLDDDDVLVVSSKVVAKALGLWHDDRDTAVDAETMAVVAERRTPNGTTRIVRSAARDR